MLLEIKVPDLQKDACQISDGAACPIDAVAQNLITLVEWYVNDREFIKQDNALCLLETSKASFEVPAEKDGYVKIVKQKGATVSVDETICLLADSPDELPE